MLVLVRFINSSSSHQILPPSPQKLRSVLNDFQNLSDSFIESPAQLLKNPRDYWFARTDNTRQILKPQIHSLGFQYAHHLKTKKQNATLN